jgi:hypothetical protein
MFFAHTTFLGIDPTAGQRPFVYSALDGELHLLALGQGDIDEVLAFVAGQRHAYVAISAPRGPNKGLMRQDEVRQGLSPVPRPGRWTDFRVAEYQLRQHNISIPQTTSNETECPNWMRMSFYLFRRLEELGYPPYSTSEDDRQSLEVYPHACYAVLLGQNPFPKHTLEGRIQRQLALYEQEINVPDPMRFFEEITRHRLLNGILPAEILYSAEELDALVAAYTAWKAALHPNQISCLGVSDEGQIILPVSELKSRY